MFDGGASITAVAPEVAPPEPPLFEAVTRSRMVCPKSASVSPYSGPVAPVTSTQPAPAESHRCHWRANDIGLAPAHAPSDPVSVSPWRGVPLIAGGVLLKGLGATNSRLLLAVFALVTTPRVAES